MPNRKIFDMGANLHKYELPDSLPTDTTYGVVVDGTTALTYGYSQSTNHIFILGEAGDTGSAAKSNIAEHSFRDDLADSFDMIGWEW